MSSLRPMGLVVVVILSLGASATWSHAAGFLPGQKRYSVRPCEEGLCLVFDPVEHFSAHVGFAGDNSLDPEMGIGGFVAINGYRFEKDPIDAPDGIEPIWSLIMDDPDPDPDGPPENDAFEMYFTEDISEGFYAIFARNGDFLETADDRHVVPLDGYIEPACISDGVIMSDFVACWTEIDERGWDPAPVPEPSTIALLVCGLLGALGLTFRHRR